MHSRISVKVGSGNSHSVFEKSLGYDFRVEYAPLACTISRTIVDDRFPAVAALRYPWPRLRRLSQIEVTVRPVDCEWLIVIRCVTAPFVRRLSNEISSCFGFVENAT